MEIKEILDEISAVSGTNDKMTILKKYADNKILKKVLYLAHSPRVKFYIKKIPTYVGQSWSIRDLTWAFQGLEPLMEQRIRGNEASAWLGKLLASLMPDDAEVLKLIIGKNVKIGMGTTNMNKVFPKLIEKTGYQGAKPFTEDLARKLFNSPHAKEEGVISDIKMDGRYGNGIVRGHESEMVSRQGEQTYVGAALFMSELALLPDCVLNGELTIYGLDRYTANGIVASIVDIEKKREERGEVGTQKKIDAFTKKHGSYSENMNNIVYTVWDMLTTDEYFDKKSVRPYKERKAELVAVLNEYAPTRIVLVESKTVYSYEEAVQHFQEALSRGLEGTIIKDANGAWKDGKPNWQVKMKLEINLDLTIVGFNYGTGKNVDVISSLQCESSDGLVVTRPTGIKEDMMQHITENQDELLGSVLEVKCSGLSQARDGNYSLLHPVFKLLRDDKDESDSLEDIKSIELAAKTLN